VKSSHLSQSFCFILGPCRFHTFSNKLKEKNRGKSIFFSIIISLPRAETQVEVFVVLILKNRYNKNDRIKKRGLNNKQIEDLKESLTFLLNEPEFKEIILVKDKGYQNHQKMRRQLKKIWRRDKNFSKFLEKSIKIIKKGRKIL